MGRRLRLVWALLLLLPLLALLPGCLPYMDADQMAAFGTVMRNLKNDHASVCVEIRGAGGAGALTISPVPIPGAGYGQGSFVLCRTNQPNTQIKVSTDAMSIDHGTK